MIYHSDIVKVTKEDIKNGTTECAESCAVALAVERTFSKHYNNLVQVEVGDNGDIEFFDKADNDYGYLLEISDIDATKIADFVNQFDGGYNVEPFEFGATIRNKLIRRRK